MTGTFQRQRMALGASLLRGNRESDTMHQQRLDQSYENDLATVASEVLSLSGVSEHTAMGRKVCASIYIWVHMYM